MKITCDCGNDLFTLTFVPPSGLVVECSECGETRPVGETRHMEGYDG